MSRLLRLLEGVGLARTIHDGAGTPYLTRVKLSPKTPAGGRLMLHVFHRGDADPVCHDHPWPYVTLPLTPYVEEVLLPDGTVRVHVVRAWRRWRRSLGFAHRVLGRYLTEPRTGRHVCDPRGRITTLVWHGGGTESPWGFWVPDEDVHMHVDPAMARAYSDHRGWRDRGLPALTWVPWEAFVHGRHYWETEMSPEERLEAFAGHQRGQATWRGMLGYVPEAFDPL